MQIAYLSQNCILKNNWYRWTDATSFQTSPLQHTEWIAFHAHLCDFASEYGVGGFALNWCWENLRLQDCGIKCEKKWVL